MKNLKKKVAIATVTAFTFGTMAFAGSALADYDSMPTMTTPVFIPSITQPEDIATHWAKDAITNMVNIKAVSGYPDKNFYPDKPVTRAELAAAMANAMYLPKGEAVELPDVSESHWAASTIATALPYLAAFADGSFRPDAPITREEVAVAIVKAAGLDNKKVDPTVVDIVFKDPKTVSPDLKKLVAVAVDQKLIKGIKQTTGKMSFDFDGNSLTPDTTANVYQVNGVWKMAEAAGTYAQGADAPAGTVTDIETKMYLKAKDMVTRGEMCYLVDAARAKVGLGNQIAGAQE